MDDFAEEAKKRWKRRNVLVSLCAVVVLLSFGSSWQSTKDSIPTILQSDGKDRIRSISSSTTNKTMMVHPPEGRIPNRTATASPIHNIPQGQSTNGNSNNPSDQQAVTVIVQLSGELGNQLQKITNGLCVQRLIEKKLGLTTKLMLRAQNHGKWKNAMISVKEAFPNLRPFNFQEGNTKEFDVVHNQQQSWIQQLVKNNQLDLTNVTANADCLNGLKCAEENCYVDLLNLLNQTWHMVDRPSNMVKDGNISIPHVYVESFVDSYCLELLYDELVLQDFLTIDENAICKQVPDSDESVFHYRNYIREMPRVGTRRGFEEADSNLTATKIFANYSRTTSPAGQGGRVAIISRFPDHVDEYIKAFQERGIEARYITNQTGNQDFCFLLKTQQEIVGSARSSFAFWAGYLGHAKRVRLYSLSTDETRKIGVDYKDYSYRHEQLRDRIRYENYNVTTF